MVADTTAANKLMDRFDQHDSVWLFAYGSLIFKVDFPWLERRPACIYHWQRRFWQGSHDHRGTPQAPGRVVTLVAQPDARCVGMAYRISPRVFTQLDQREKNGYYRFAARLYFDDAGAAEAEVDGLVYIATADNEAYLGPASDAEIARHIAVATGPSGANSDYLRQLAEALRLLCADDPHVYQIERLLPPDR